MSKCEAKQMPEFSRKFQKMELKYYDAHGAAGLLFVLIVLCTYIVFVLQPQSTNLVDNIVGPNPGEQSGREKVPSKLKLPNEKELGDIHVQSLIEAIQKATRLAAGGEDEGAWFTTEARDEWHRNNPCLSAQRCLRNTRGGSTCAI